MIQLEDANFLIGDDSGEFNLVKLYGNSMGFSDRSGGDLECREGKYAYTIKIPSDGSYYIRVFKEDQDD